MAVAAIALALVALLAAVVLVTHEYAHPAVPVVPDSLVKIDPKSGKIVDVFGVGGGPFKPAVVGDYVFVSSLEDQVLSRVDTRSGEVDTIGGLPSPAGVADGGDVPMLELAGLRPDAGNRGGILVEPSCRSP